MTNSVSIYLENPETSEKNVKIVRELWWGGGQMINMPKLIILLFISDKYLEMEKGKIFYS